MMAFNDEPGDCENLSRFYECYKEKLLKFAVYLLKDPERAADAVQNSAENLVRYYDSVRRLPEDKILSYSMAVYGMNATPSCRKMRGTAIQTWKSST